MIGATIGTALISSGKTEYTFPNGTQGYTTNNNNWNITISPSIGWFIQNNSVVGGSIILNSSHQKTWNENTSGLTYKEDNYHNTDFGLGVFYRYYFSTSNTIKPFGHIYINGGSGTTKTDGFYNTSAAQSESYTGKSSDKLFYNLGVNAGITKMINSTIGLEAFVGYVHSYSKFTTKTKSVMVLGSSSTTAEYEPTQRFSGNGVSVGVGLQIFLSK